jgi:hypothetical protein
MAWASYGAWKADFIRRLEGQAVAAAQRQPEDASTESEPTSTEPDDTAAPAAAGASRRRSRSHRRAAASAAAPPPAGPAHWRPATSGGPRQPPRTGRSRPGPQDPEDRDTSSELYQLLDEAWAAVDDTHPAGAGAGQAGGETAHPDDFRALLDEVWLGTSADPRAIAT